MQLNLLQMPETIIMVILEKLLTAVQDWCLKSILQAREKISLPLSYKDGL